MRGQYFSFDAIIASVIFIMTIISLLSYWHSTKTMLEHQHGDVVKEALRISELLLLPGYPPDTPCGGMKQIGFGISFTDKRLNKSRISECTYYFTPDKCSSLSEKVGTFYNVSIKISDGTEICPLPANSKDISSIAKVRRMAAVVGEDNKEKLEAIDIFVYK